MAAAWQDWKCPVPKLEEKLEKKNIYSEGELDETATTEEFSVVRQEGKRQVKRNIIFNEEAMGTNSKKLGTTEPPHIGCSSMLPAGANRGVIGK